VISATLLLLQPQRCHIHAVGIWPGAELGRAAFGIDLDAVLGLAAVGIDPEAVLGGAGGPGSGGG
jgi:hypothetical protein